MNNTILQTDNLTHRFGNVKALENVSISLSRGHIYGFIGENGSGKTTLMRIFTGLLYCTSGTFKIFGESSPEGLERARKKIGSTIEMPTLYPGFTAKQNLELQRTLLGNPDRSICDEMLKLVDLYDVKDKKAGTFSMGMKQRLNIAMSLLGNPQLLILDEPVNGLDPKNIAALRKTLKMLNEEKNMTLFISSHILSELYLLATDFIIIHKGRIVDVLTHDQLEVKCRKYVRIKTDNLPLCLTVLEKELKTSDYKVKTDDVVHLYTNIDDSTSVLTALVKNGIAVSELSVSEESLEEYFLSVTGGEAK